MGHFSAISFVENKLRMSSTSSVTNKQMTQDYFDNLLYWDYLYQMITINFITMDL